MDCKKISPYFDGELEEKKRDRMKIHLNNCLSCQKEILRLTQLHTLIKSRRSTLSPDFTQKVISKISQEKQEAVFSSALLLRLRVATALALVIFVLGISLELVSGKKLQNNLSIIDVLLQPKNTTLSESIVFSDEQITSNTVFQLALANGE